jgi:hypothetical protein
VLTGSGDSVFVGSYTGDDGGGFLRSVEKGLWTTLTQTDNGHTITQLWADSQQLYYVVSGFQDRAEVRRLNLDTQQTETLDVNANLVWSHSETDIAVFALGTVRQFDSTRTRWNERRMSIGKPVAVAGRSRDALYVLGSEGAIAQADGPAFIELHEQPKVVANDIAVQGDTLLAVSGDDLGNGKSGPGLIMRYSEGHWEELQVAPEDALLGVASTDNEVYAVGGSRDGSNALAVVWHYDGKSWSRKQIAGLSGFLWDVWCGENQHCYAAGTENAFVDLSELVD